MQLDLLASRAGQTRRYSTFVLIASLNLISQAIIGLITFQRGQDLSQCFITPCTCVQQSYTINILSFHLLDIVHC